MNKLNQRLALIANLSVVAGIVFLATEVRQNSLEMAQNTVVVSAQAVFQQNQEATSSIGRCMRTRRS